MIQIFFIAPSPANVKQALDSMSGQRTHAWRPTDASPIIGVVEVTTADTEQVAAALEAAGVSLLPDSKGNEPISADQLIMLEQFGVTATDTTKSAMAKVHGVSGFPHHKVKRY